MDRKWVAAVDSTRPWGDQELHRRPACPPPATTRLLRNVVTFSSTARPVPFLGRMRKRACKEQVKNRRQGVALAARDSPATMLCGLIVFPHGHTWAISDRKQLC